MAHHQSNAHDGREDFDFIMGEWNVHHRRLRERLKGSSSWEEFDGKSVAQHILGGIGNIQDLTAEWENGHLDGFTLRLFDLAAREWSIYWTSSATGRLDLPMIGRFVNGRGEFFAHETHDGRHVYSRFLWTDITPTSVHWEQALSADGGRTWETNWVMDFMRA